MVANHTHFHVPFGSLAYHEVLASGLVPKYEIASKQTNAKYTIAVDLYNPNKHNLLLGDKFLFSEKVWNIQNCQKIEKLKIELKQMKKAVSILITVQSKS